MESIIQVWSTRTSFIQTILSRTPAGEDQGDEKDWKQKSDVDQAQPWIQLLGNPPAINIGS